ncbi:MAG: cytoskeleton protein RodZ [Bryobacterales bacterium]|nr:cytoskeleton protein RodZ [Bryobacterales bacterium]
MDTISVGALLRQERLRQGKSLEEIASRTRISQRFLEAIEVDDIGRTPGLVFVRSFVRQYASALGMDAKPLMADLPKVDLESVLLPNPAYAAHPRHRDPRWAAALSSAMWVVLVAGTSVGGYLYLNRQQPLANTHPVSAQAADSTAVPGLNDSQPNPVAAAAPDTIPDPANHAVQVILKAREASWVQITADGKNAFTGILNPNDSRAVEADALIKVTAGNAGGVEISLNGKSLDPLGHSGQVRTVRLTAEGLQPPKTVQISSSAL